MIDDVDFSFNLGIFFFIFFKITISSNIIITAKINKRALTFRILSLFNTSSQLRLSKEKYYFFLVIKLPFFLKGRGGVSGGDEILVIKLKLLIRCERTKSTH